MKPLQFGTVKKIYKGDGDYQFMKKYQPMWLPDNIKLSVEIVYNGYKYF